MSAYLSIQGLTHLCVGMLTHIQPSENAPLLVPQESQNTRKGLGWMSKQFSQRFGTSICEQMIKYSSEIWVELDLSLIRAKQVEVRQ